MVYEESKGYWTPSGGSVEEGESARDAVCREVKEETNMQVLRQRFIGYQDILSRKVLSLKLGRYVLSSRMEILSAIPTEI